MNSMTARKPGATLNELTAVDIARAVTPGPNDPTMHVSAMPLPVFEGRNQLPFWRTTHCGVQWRLQTVCRGIPGLSPTHVSDVQTRTDR